MSDALRFDGVVKTYGRRRALDGLSLRLPTGVIAGLVGSNGAGKTTLMGVAAGLLSVRSGAVDVLGEGPFDPARHAGRVALLPQDSELPRDAPPGALLTFYAELQGLDRRAARRQAAELLERVHLSDRARSPCRTLSHGMRRRVMLAQCFLGAPELVLLDEPLNGLDPRETAAMREFLRGQRGRRTLLISSHNLHEIEAVCDYVIFIEQGRLVRADTLEAVTGRAEEIIYLLAEGAAPDVAALRAALTEAAIAIEFDAFRRALSCRYRADRHDAAAVNAAVAPRLLAMGCPLLEIHRGERLETRYLTPRGE